jgi:glutamine synthetase
MAAVPDMATLRPTPHIAGGGIVLADLWWNPERPVEISPRAVLRRQLEAARAMGVVPWAALEYEFYLYADTFETARAKGYRDLEPLHRSHQDYGVYRSDRDEPFLGTLRRALEQADIPIESVKSEMGHGQYELTIEPCDALTAADRASLFKLFAREIAAQHGMSATFMARLSHADMGSSGHVHVSLQDAAGVNLFDPGDHELSPQGRAFIGGVMRRAPEFMLLACPYVNSYKRLDPENFVTAALDFGLEGRTVPFRVCGHGRTRNLEYRIPGADGNPYLVLAGVVAAGLEGLAAGVEPFLAGSAEAEAVGDLPDNLRDAIERWQASAWARETFGDLVVDTLAVTARHELDIYRREVSEIELRRGFEWA